MKTLEELREENRRLKLERESKIDMKKIQMERKALNRENKQLKSPRRYAFLSGTRKVAGKVGKLVISNKPVKRKVRKFRVGKRFKRNPKVDMSDIYASI